ncbi:MAG: hypothetical protein AAGC93_16635 [Cyanobacteria bacterium P01_F01_bin.53]
MKKLSKRAVEKTWKLLTKRFILRDPYLCGKGFSYIIAPENKYAGASRKADGITLLLLLVFGASVLPHAGGLFLLSPSSLRRYELGLKVPESDVERQ